MGQKWFKFYGQDWLTDPKVIKLDPIHRLCFITLLCLAGASEEQGVIKDLDEDVLLTITHISFDPSEMENDWSRGIGVLKILTDNGMITHDNGTITIPNFIKRQETNLTGYERVKRFRQKQKVIKNNVIIDNGRVDKNRIEKRYYPPKGDFRESPKPTAEETKAMLKRLTGEK